MRAATASTFKLLGMLLETTAANPLRLPLFEYAELKGATTGGDQRPTSNARDIFNALPSTFRRIEVFEGM
eukprot:3536109-Alexandrium_andersonii.AAC.1